jgi:hypothetical protein
MLCVHLAFLPAPSSVNLITGLFATAKMTEVKSKMQRIKAAVRTLLPDLSERITLTMH